LNKKNLTNNIPLNAYTQHANPENRLRTQHQITTVIINKVSLFKNEIISVNVSKTITDVFIATDLRCPR